MKDFKSHLTFTKQQRSGILFLLLLIVALQCVYVFIDVPSEDTKIDAQEIAFFQAEIDSLKAVKIEESTPKIYPFNPNFITDYKGYTLGMSNEEIDRLLAFRKQNKWINSAEDFQKVTLVSDELLDELSPYFKFPEWITNPKPKTYSYDSNTPKTYDQKIDLNLATASQLKRVNGIGEKLSERIVAYRAKLGGRFTSEVQLQDVYGLSEEVIQRINNDFVVKTPKEVSKISLNSATIEELVTIQHIDYEIANYILQERTLREGFKSLDELTKVKDFPIKKIEIIKLYLTL
ncbi:ComEA family DNA-binding protein [Psychroserpens sp. XS_ASV72]|uniref:ComEA family DNA-binding protein n=1 Tax=Psychroserpens sp. XS_ASV72 TaxID=3241293 RepID=UPI0035146289